MKHLKAKAVWMGSLTCLSPCFFWKKAQPLRWSASCSPYSVLKIPHPSPRAPNIHEAQGFHWAQASWTSIRFYRDKWIPAPGKSKRHQKILWCLVRTPHPYIEGHVCFATTKSWSYLVYWALAPDFKGRSSLRGHMLRFSEADPSSPLSSQHTQWEKPWALHSLSFLSFKQLSLSTRLTGVIAVLFLTLISSLLLEFCLAQAGPHLSAREKPQVSGHWITDWESYRTRQHLLVNYVFGYSSTRDNNYGAVALTVGFSSGRRCILRRYCSSFSPSERVSFFTRVLPEP